MGKKKARAKDKPTPKPKSLRKQLRRAEADLGKAITKRDRAQARVDALTIIADEIRARLAEVEKADAAGKKEKVAGSKAKSDASVPADGAEAESTAARKPAARKPAAAKRRASTAGTTAAKRSSSREAAE